MINSRKQNGSILVITLIAVVVILGVLGYVVWSNFLAPKNTDMQQDSTQLETTNESTEETKNDGYIVLNDWQVKFKIDDTLKSTKVLYYERSTNDNPPRDYYAFTTTRIQELGGKCTEQPFGDTVILYRYAEKPIATPDGELINEEALNGYYYVVTSPIASCSSFDENGRMQSPSQVEVNDRAALKESLRKLMSE